MPLPKVTRFVSDGEVDPGVSAVAKAISSTFMFAGDVAKATGLDREQIAYESQKTAWFVASRGAGVFAADAFTEAPSRINVSSLSFKAIPWSAATDGYGGWTFTTTNKIQNGVDLWAPWFAAAVLKEPGKDFYASFDKDKEKRENDLMSARGFYTLEQLKDAFKKAARVEESYRNQFASQPYVDLIVESLMFFDPSGGAIDEMKKYDNPLDTGLYIARATASAVPLLGRKWIVADLVTEGVPVAEAKEKAFLVYDRSSNYFSWRRGRDRFLNIKKTLQAIDPNITDEEVQAITDLNLPADEIVRFYQEKFAPKPKGGRAIAALGAGALAAFAFGGPVGLAVGLGVLWLTSGKSEPRPS